MCHFDEFADRGDCVADGGATSECRRGAEYCGRLLPGYIVPTSPLLMPPPPAMLNDWERDVLMRWAKDPIE
jgi:hypothetical protein